jgi:predicted transcriptional regulator
MAGRVSDPGSIVISVHKEYADAIIGGRKTIELRRRFPDVPVGTKIWIYATKPVGAVIGFAVLKGLERGTPSTIWKKHSSQTGIDARSYDNYFAGAETAVALTISGAQKVKPVSLAKLKDIRTNFHPPQIVARLSSGEDHVLTKLALVNMRGNGSVP